VQEPAHIRHALVTNDASREATSRDCPWTCPLGPRVNMTGDQLRALWDFEELAKKALAEA
jgi:hypothetical protein